MAQKNRDSKSEMEDSFTNNSEKLREEERWEERGRKTSLRS
jgi:hypothetical protein